MLYHCTNGTYINAEHIDRIDEPENPLDGNHVATLSGGSTVELHARDVRALQALMGCAQDGRFASTTPAALHIKAASA